MISLEFIFTHWSDFLHCFQLLLFKVAILMPSGVFSLIIKSVLRSVLSWISQRVPTLDISPWHMKDRYRFNMEKLKK